MSNPLENITEDTMQSLINELGENFVDLLRGQVDGAITDLQIVGTDIARNLMETWQIEDDEVREATRKELAAQGRLLLEQRRIRASEATWRVVEASLDAATGIAFTFLRTATGVI